MTRRIAALIVGSALYGFAIGSVHSTKFAIRNLVKLPLLLLVTAGVCALAFYVTARTVTRALDFRLVQTRALMIFRDLAVLLGSLGPVMLFLAYAIVRPDARGLNEYPLFMGMNVIVIAICGCVAIVRQANGLFEDHGVSRGQAAFLLATWTAISLLVGAQWSWYLRPFCGVATIDAPFMLGTTPDFRGARSFYEAVYHLWAPEAAGSP